MPAIGAPTGDARLAGAAPKRSCGDCVHCHVLGVDELGRPLTHCEQGLWVNKRVQKTMKGAINTRIQCPEFEDG